MEKRHPNKEFKKLVEYSNEARKNKRIKFYDNKKPREINWNAYNLSQVNDAKETLLFIKKEADKCQNPKRKAGRPSDYKSLAKAILVCEALGFTERKAQGWLEIIGPFIGIY